MPISSTGWQQARVEEPCIEQRSVVSALRGLQNANRCNPCMVAVWGLRATDSLLLDAMFLADGLFGLKRFFRYMEKKL